MSAISEKIAYANETKALIAQAIVNKGGTVADTDEFRDYATRIGDLPSGGFTGHVDAEGLAEIGWNETDIAYYQERVWWNEADDKIYIVSQYDKRCYAAYTNGTITAADIRTDWSYVTHLPKVDLSGVTNLDGYFMAMTNLFAIPALDTSDATSAEQLFRGCTNLAVVPMLDFTNVTSLTSAFRSCVSLIRMEFGDMPALTSLSDALRMCYALQTVTFGTTPNLTDLSATFSACYSLKYIGELDCTNVTDTADAFDNCYALEWCYLKNIGVTFSLFDAKLINGYTLNYIVYYAQTFDRTAADFVSPTMQFPVALMSAYQDSTLWLGNCNSSDNHYYGLDSDWIDVVTIMVMSEKGWTGAM